MAVSFIDAGNCRIILFVKGHWQKTIELSHDVVHLAFLNETSACACGRLVVFYGYSGFLHKKN
jgi:hypothetical protein